MLTIYEIKNCTGHDYVCLIRKNKNCKHIVGVYSSLDVLKTKVIYDFMTYVKEGTYKIDCSKSNYKSFFNSIKDISYEELVDEKKK